MELIIEMIIPQTTTNRAITFNPGAVVYGMQGLIWLDPHQEVGHWLVQEKFCGLNFYPISGNVLKLHAYYISLLTCRLAVRRFGTLNYLLFFIATYIGQG